MLKGEEIQQSLLVSRYEEIKDWSFVTSQSAGGVTGHFTQMVWKQTTKVGYGFVTLPTPGYV